MHMEIKYENDVIKITFDYNQCKWLEVEWEMTFVLQRILGLMAQGRTLAHSNTTMSNPTCACIGAVLLMLLLLLTQCCHLVQGCLAQALLLFHPPECLVPLALQLGHC